TVSGTVKNLGMVDFKYKNTEGDTRAGSVAGQVLTGGTITNCYSVGHSITTKSNIAGGIAGCTYGGTISNCYALNGSVTGHGDRWGGVVGDCKKDSTAPDLAQTYGTVSNCYTDNTRVASTQNNSANITNCAVKDDAAFASGEITYLLNGSSSEDVTWYQTLKTDTYPVLDSKHGIVYSVFKCDGTTPAGYSNENKNKSHADENGDGYCDVCGTIINGIGVNLAGHSVSLGGQVGMNFYMDLDDSVLADGEAHMLFTLPGVEEPVKVYVKDVKNSSVNIEENTYYVFTCNVAAKDMAGTITAKIVRGDGSEGTEYTYSVREYAEDVMGKYGESSNEYKLAKAMLNYGAYAQKYFDPNVAAGELANVNYPYEAGEFTVTTSGMKNYVPTVTDESEILDYVGSTLILEADIKVRHYFKLKDGQTYSGNLTQYVAQQENPVDGTYYYYESAGITVANLGVMDDYTGVTGISISYCPLSYVTTVLANENADLGNDTALQNLMKALYLYYKATVAPNNQS
ncbi:MAG: hypothetical protein IJX95_13270, partial [Lachnospiraceae bacterium]|nr:hypothetical protein [Lachnospiraceae bacterium]